MADPSLAFDPDKCDVEAVERIPPCETLIIDPTIPVAPDPITDCPTQPFEQTPESDCPLFDPAYPHTGSVTNNFNLESRLSYTFAPAITTQCEFDFNLSINITPELSPVVIVNATPASGRYQGVRMIERGLPATWEVGDPVWVYNPRGSALIPSHIYRVRWNPITDRFLGLRQGWTLDCCDDLIPSTCCDAPVYSCVRFSSPCGELDGKSIQLRNNGGRLTIWGRTYTFIVYCLLPDLGPDGLRLAVTFTVDDPNDPNIGCRLVFDSFSVTSCSPSDFHGDISGHIVRDTVSTSHAGGCACNGDTFTATIDDGFCVGTSCTDTTPCSHENFGDTVCASLRSFTTGPDGNPIFGDIVDSTTLSWQGDGWAGCFCEFCFLEPIYIFISSPCCQGNSGIFNHAPCPLTTLTITTSPLLAIYGFTSTACFYVPPCSDFFVNGVETGLVVEVTEPPCESNRSCLNCTQCVAQVCDHIYVPVFFLGFLAADGDCPSGLDGMPIYLRYGGGVGLGGGFWHAEVLINGFTLHINLVCGASAPLYQFHWEVFFELTEGGFCEAEGTVDVNNGVITVTIGPMDLACMAISGCFLSFSASFNSADCDYFIGAFPP